ncbi:hypothetical protein CRENBAI_016345 [Crenichthys baileyi]|uniref:Zinc finger and BTB domain-containing protein 32 n=1 Tax=Crenichthys baileyi TaxID=28760 RepID=A0AAV9RRE7_9TELE
MNRRPNNEGTENTGLNTTELRDTQVSQHWGLMGESDGDCSTDSEGIAAAQECGVRAGPSPIFPEPSEMIRINNTQYFHFLQQADVLRRSGTLCDAIISVQSQTFQAHRLVLACASRALAQHLAKGDADSPAHCTLEYFSPHTFQQVLDFTYTQALEVPVKDLQQLLRAAQLLEMQLLEDQCRKQLRSLKDREKDENGEAVDLTEEKKSAEEKDQKQKGYSRFHPHPYAQNLCTETPRMGSMVKNGLLKRKKLSQSSQTGETRYAEVPKVRERAEECQHCSTRVLCDPVLRESASTQLGQSCDGCQFCGRDAVQHDANARDHRGEKPYQCKHCPKKFSLKHQLDTHHRVHTGEKPFECRLCGQRSRDYSAMIKHLRTHGGAAPYQCTVCLEFCSSLVAMQRHVKSHAVQDFPPDWSINNTYLYISHI